MRAFRVRVPAGEEDDATTAFWGAGTSGMEVKADTEGNTVLVAYFPDGMLLEDVNACLAGLPGSPRAMAVEVPEVDWVKRFREGFRGFKAGSFEILPAWELAPDRDPGDAGLLVVEPGRAFGTGTHETTRLCLGAIETLATEGSLGRTLDLGTGAGLLAVAAAKRGARGVVGIDNDPEAVLTAREHAALNGVRIGVVLGDGARALRPGAFHLVLANLTAPLLRSRREEIVALLAPGAWLVLSGILAEEAGDTIHAYSDLGAPRRRDQGDWACLVFRRQP